MLLGSRGLASRNEHTLLHYETVYIRGSIETRCRMVRACPPFYWIGLIASAAEK